MISNAVYLKKKNQTKKPRNKDEENVTNIKMLNLIGRYMGVCKLLAAFSFKYISFKRCLKD